MASSMSSDAHPEEGESRIKRVRGVTKAKNTTRLVKHSNTRLPVTIDEQFNALVGENASKVANLLGVQLRNKAPVEGVSKWGDIDHTIRDSIIQGMLDMFVIEGNGKDNATKIIDAKCKDLYKGWRCRARRYYAELLAEGKNPYAHCFPTMEDSKWKYMIENVWNTEKFKARSNINKQNRDKLSSTHTMGSKSFASALYKISNEARENLVQPKFSEFFRQSHHSNKKKRWIDQRYEEEHAALEVLEKESLETEEPISPKKLSQTAFGKKYYLKGLGPTIKPSSRIRSNGASSSNGHDIQALTTEVEMLRHLSQEYEERLVAQGATIQSQDAEIGSLNRKVENMANQQKRFMAMVIAGGTMGDGCPSINLD